MGMKVTLFALVVGLLIVGCGEDIVDIEKLQNRDGVAYLPNEETPFTGRAANYYVTGQKNLEANYKDGKLDGLLIKWYENGQKKSEGNFKDDRADGPVTLWYEDGQKKQVGNNKDGNLDGLCIYYNEDGTEWKRITYKDGKPVN